MNPTAQVETEFYGLVGDLREGTISAEQKARLDVLLGQYPPLRKTYVDYILLWHELRCYQPLSQVERASVTRQIDIAVIEQEAQRRLDRFLAEEEKIRELRQSESASGFSADIVEVALWLRRRLASLYRIAVGGAVLALLVFVVVLAVQYVRAGSVVARLADSMNARWDGVPDANIAKDTSLRAGPFVLRQGYAQIVFQKGAAVWIEAPAEFRLKSDQRMTLDSGRMFAEVPPSAKGFTVVTPYAKVVDLGTQFGISTDVSTTSDLHLFKGQASLTPTAAGQTGAGRILSAGQADSVDSTGHVRDIQIDNRAFVRRFFRASGFVWKGQIIDLADVVGGGNGLGTGQLNRWLGINTGTDGTKYIVNGHTKMSYQTTDNRYHRVTHLPYVDGVFSPDGSAGPVQVSSQGNTWRDGPRTSGRFFEDIFNGDYIDVGDNSHRLILNGQAYGTREHPAIALHSNSGITFDLNAVRRVMPGLEIVRFRALCGISEDVRRFADRTPAPKNADFWVLVDGQKRFEALGVDVNSEAREISVTLSGQERFLTLVTTDGDGQPNYDWCFFAEPRLEVRVVQQK